ncbi:2747_t:CDS:2 [Funneliformis caledonium]|uniref:2747_t:CDS:1 n=1 Tax=Funneliformis caledonium TaxID=1117310 RepID=A0A9N9A5C6_9GLOM|nr:2747_t:CDS:2 [Funneliformis caledonium]
MAVCKFFLEGRCSFGSTCRNEHPPESQQRNNQRFGATGSSTQLQSRLGGFGSSSASKIYDEKTVRADLSRDRPSYKYSCYGPAKEEPNLIEGTDFSAEELRVQYYNIMSTNGNDTAYRAGVKDLDDRMHNQIEITLRDLRSTLSRFDAKRQQLAQEAVGGFGGFGQPQPTQSQPEPPRQGAYGAPSVLGAPALSTPSLFGSSMNQPNQPSTPSILGSSYNQPAATPSLFGSNPSGFGSSTFGGNSSLGYPGGVQAQPNPGFGGGLGRNPQGTINNPQMQAFPSQSEFELYKIPEIPPPSEFRR